MSIFKSLKFILKNLHLRGVNWIDLAWLQRSAGADASGFMIHWICSCYCLLFMHYTRQTPLLQHSTSYWFKKYITKYMTGCLFFVYNTDMKMKITGISPRVGCTNSGLFLCESMVVSSSHTMIKEYNMHTFGCLAWNSAEVWFLM